MKHLAGLFGLLFVSAALAQAPLSGGTATGTGYPTSALPFAASGTGTTSATVTVPLIAGQVGYLCGLTMTQAGGTAVSAVGTVTNISGISLSFAALGQVAVTFTPCLVASGNIVGTTPTTTGATNSAITLTGYKF
jgi:hypothetical protein